MPTREAVEVADKAVGNLLMETAEQTPGEILLERVEQVGSREVAAEMAGREATIPPATVLRVSQARMVQVA